MLGEALLGAGLGIAGDVFSNERNIWFQQRENEITRAREDNAVQRRAADLESAGLSKTLAAGSPAVAAQLRAPQGETGIASRGVNQFMDILKQQADISQTLAATELTRVQRTGAGIRNTIDWQTAEALGEARGYLVNRLGTSPGHVAAQEAVARASSAGTSAAEAERTAKIMRALGLPSNIGWDPFTRGGFVVGRGLEALIGMIKEAPAAAISFLRDAARTSRRVGTGR